MIRRVSPTGEAAAESLRQRENLYEHATPRIHNSAGIRIRGAMLDEIRKGDWTPRSVHRNGRAITEAISQVESETGRDARDSDKA